VKTKLEYFKLGFIYASLFGTGLAAGLYLRCSPSQRTGLWSQPQSPQHTAPCPAPRAWGSPSPAGCSRGMRSIPPHPTASHRSSAGVRAEPLPPAWPGRGTRQPLPCTAPNESSAMGCQPALQWALCSCG